MEEAKAMEASVEKITDLELEALGFKTAAKTLKELTIKKKKMALAYEHYRFVRQDKIDAFNKNLREKTETRKPGPWGDTIQYNQLVFTPIQNYKDAPPREVLNKLAESVKRGCFDAWEIAHIESVVKVPDPILFGRIEGCSDRFFISQWEDDVKIEDILKDNEG